MAGLAHLGVGFAAKQLSPKIPIGVLLIASIAPDLLSILLTFLGIEGHGNMPWSHGLFMSSIISVILFGLIFFFTKKLRWALVLGFVVFSHWILDFISWPMTIVYSDAQGVPVFFDNSLRIGLGVHRHLVSAIIFEVLFTGIGLILYILALRKLRSAKEKSAGTSLN